MPGLAHLDWNLLRSFEAVAREGALGRAAKHLGLAHPTVARHIQLLEEQLGLALFDRTSNGLVLNDLGRRLAQVSQAMGEEAAQFVALAETARKTPDGVVRITVAELLAELAPTLLAGLQDFSGDRQRVFELIVSAEALNLLEGDADIAIRHMRPAQQELLCRKVGDLPLAAYASPAYVARMGTPTRATHDQHWYIDGVTEQRFTAALKSLGGLIPPSRIAFRSDALEARSAAAAAGWGIVALPRHLGDTDRRLQRLELGPEGEQLTLPIWVVARPSVRQRLLLRTVSDTLAEGLRQHFAANFEE
jgi:DNA-binding transcriptional LysR family regulator